MCGGGEYYIVMAMDCDQFSRYIWLCNARSKYILPPFWVTRLNSKISPTKVDDEWWNIFYSLQKHPINALVFLKKIMFTNALIAMHACIKYMHWSIFS